MRRNYIFIAAALLFGNLLSASQKTWGVYQIYWNPAQFEDGLDQQIAQFDATPDYVLFFRDIHPGRGFPTAPVEICHNRDITPVISVEFWHWGKADENGRPWLDVVNSGELDAYWRKWAQDAKVVDGPVIMRLGFEMNGDWFAWGQQPKAFIAAWQRIYRIVRNEVGADNVQFMFSPNVLWDASKPLQAIELYYPGDDYVDLLGLDGYNFGDHHSKWHRWTSYEAIYEASIAFMAQSDKPLFIAEIGCADGPRKAEWMAQFLTSFKEDKRLHGFIYYNYADGKNNEPNWRLDSDPESERIFKEAVRTLE